MTKACSLFSLCLVLLLISCSPVKKELYVYAASSLTDVLPKLINEFQKNHETINVYTNLAGSQSLKFQIKSGVRADIMISANKKHIVELVSLKLAFEVRAFAKNQLTLISYVKNSKVEKYSDLTKNIRLVIANRDVPIGSYTDLLLDNYARRYENFSKQKILKNVISNESSARRIRNRIELKQADAGFVYHTDAISTNKIIKIDLEPSLNVIAEYYIASIGAKTEAIDSFRKFLESKAATRILIASGFQLP